MKLVVGQLKLIKNKYNSEEYLGNLIFKLNKIKRVRLYFVFTLNHHQERIIKLQKSLQMYNTYRELEQNQFFGRFYPLFNSGFKDFMNNDSKKKRLLKRGFVVRIDVFLKTSFFKWQSVSMLVFL